MAVVRVSTTSSRGFAATRASPGSLLRGRKRHFVQQALPARCRYRRRRSGRGALVNRNAAAIGRNFQGGGRARPHRAFQFRAVAVGVFGQRIAESIINAAVVGNGNDRKRCPFRYGQLDVA